MDPALLRAWWFHRQGLDGSFAGLSSAEVLARSGWVRSVGGAAPYLALFARNGARRAEVDADVAALRLHELPSARGCTYVLPAADFATGLRASQGFADAAAIQTAKKYLGVTDAELDALDRAVLGALTDGPLEPAALKDHVGPAVRNLGPEGKKRGQTTTLPLSLGRLQTQGHIRRISTNGRLDRQRYAYERWEPSPLAGDTRPDDAVFVELARRYFAWAGPATAAQFQAFSGLGVRAAKAAVAAAGLVPLAEGDERLLLPEDREALRAFSVPAEPCVAVVAGLDGHLLHRRELGPLLDPADRAHPLWAAFTETAGGALMDLPCHAILDRGRVVGLWEWDAARDEPAGCSFQSAGDAVRAALARVADFVRADLGDVRAFSLDSPESRAPRIEALRRFGG